MAYTILSNKKNRSVAVHVTGANVSLTVAGNTSSSNVATSDELLTGASVSKVIWGVDTGSCMVYRGANLISTHTQSGSIDFAAMGLAIDKDSGATLDVKFNGTANGFVIVELKKKGAGTFGTSDYLHN